MRTAHRNNLRSAASLRPWTTALAALSACLLVATTGRTEPESDSPTAPPSLTEPPAPGPAPHTFRKAFVLPVHDEISEVTLKSLERRIDEALSAGADLLIFDIDTPGGIVYTTLEICTKIKNLSNVHTVAWIHPKAFSAGAIIALACNEIVMSPRSTLGDSQPIIIGPGGPAAVGEDIEAKVTSPLIEEVRDSARRNGYDIDLCMAMIRPEMEIFWLENTESGQRDFVDRAQRDELFGIEPSTGPIRKTVDEKDGDEETGRTSYQPGQRVSDSMSQTAWRYVKSVPGLDHVAQPIDSDRVLLTMSQDEAVAYGFARGKISRLMDFETMYPIQGAIQYLEYTWSEHLVSFLSGPLVRGVLFILILMGAYTEFKSPGLGLPGLVALVALALFLGAPYLTGMASALDIVLLLLGVALLLVEIFLIPGFGLAGIGGLLLIVAGLVMSFTPAERPGPFYWPTFNYRYTLDGLKWGLTVLAGGMVFMLIFGILLSRFMPRMPYVGRVVAANPTPATVAADIPHPFAAHVGDEGVAEGPLRPAGKARFGAELVDVVSEGEFIEPRTRVRVVERRGNRVVVRSVESHA